MQTRTFDAQHEDLIHDIAYDYYGKRLVTCSSDHKLKVFDQDDTTSSWILNDSWKGHDGSILKVSWAHPEFGQLFASCSLDRTVRIWEEQEGEIRNGGRRWFEKAKLADSRASILTIQFSPSHIGLRLATCSCDGIIRIYEAMDVMNLSQWSLMDEIEVSSQSVGDSIFCLSWCPSRFAPPMMVVGCGKENVAKVYRLDQNSKWHPCEVLSGHTDVVLDVAWAPSMGRSTHQIATACRDQSVRIYKLKPESLEKDAQVIDSKLGGLSGALQQAQKGKPKYTAELVADLNDHQSEVWKVDWNITGTVLASSCDDGKVRLWKASFIDEWKSNGVIGK